jgi:protein SCO1/2
MNKKFVFTALGVIFVVAFAAFVLQASVENSEQSSGSSGSSYQSTRAISGSTIGGPFDLIDEDGAVFTDAELKRPYRLIYFGFTYCPAICPTELAKTLKAFKQLDPALQDQIDLVFVTIDPERDTAEIMKQYTDLFHERLIGLTGTQAQIDKVLSDYKVYASKVQDETMSDYTMDHSSYIYLFTDQNIIRAMYRMSDEAAFIAEDLGHLLR